MRIFLALAALVGLVSADVGLGYHYNPPSTSYGVPAQTTSGFSSSSAGSAPAQASYPTHQGGSYHAAHQASGYQQTVQVQPAPAFTASQASAQSGYQSGSGYQTAQQFGSGYQSGVGLNAHHSGSGYQSGAAYQQAGQQTGFANHAGSGYHAGSAYQHGGGQANAHYKGSSSVGVAQPSSQFSGSSSTVQGGFQNRYSPASQSSQSSYVQQYQEYYKQQQQQPAQVFKHFYVHAAPEEPEQPKFRQPPVLPAPQKHYKIIFIKTPTPAPAAPQYIPVQPQNEEKTIVYVLVKKPEEAPEVVLPKIEQKPPTKPEVFFIKYSGKEDSQHVINNIVNDYNVKGQDGSVSFSGVDAASSGFASGQNQVVHDSQHSVGLSSPQSAGTFDAVVGSLESQTASSLASVDSNSVSGSYDSSYSSQSLSDGSQSGYSGGYTGGEAQAVAQVAETSYSGASAGDVQEASQGAYSGAVQSQENYSSVATSQGVPHEAYGTPKFRLQ